MPSPRVWAEIDLAAVRHNLGLVRQTVGPKVQILAVVKADAYGHGAGPVARAAMEAGATWLGVGDAGEALELRESGITAPIIVLGALVERELDEIVEHRITPTVHSRERIRELASRAAARGVRMGVHLMVDTGMGRLGVRPGSALSLLAEVASHPSLFLEGMATHFPCSALEDTRFTDGQLEQMQQLVRGAEEARLRPRYVHVANSAAVFAFPHSHYDMVRPGGILYGIDSGNLRRLKIPMKPALTLRSQIVYLKGVPPGFPISYDHTYRCERPTQIATLPVGYNDGFPMPIHKRPEVLVRGRRCPVVGRVTMDYIMVDVGGVPGVRVGDPATLIGAEGPERITAEDQAACMGVVPYHITCRLGKRVRKRYVSSDQP